VAAYIALLRGVNLGGNKMVAMADLRGLCGKLGLSGAQTVVQSGNLVFECSGQRAAALEQTLEREIEKRLGVETTVFVRSAKEWRALIGKNPLRREAASAPGLTFVLCLKSRPAPDAEKALRAAIAGPEIVHVDGRQAYMYYPDGMGQSKVRNTLIEKKFGTLTTARNWNTVMKLAALVGE
jgi:uncharacterized protein (DUF1697 family)